MLTFWLAVLAILAAGIALEEADNWYESRHQRR